MKSVKTRLLALVANIAAVVGAAALIWVPEISAYWVWPPSVSDAVVNSARGQQNDLLLEELSRQRLGMWVIPRSNPAQERADAVLAAELLLRGQAKFKWQPLLPLKVPFDESNLIVGPPTFSLFAGGMGTVDLLLRAYRITGDERFLDVARVEVANIASVDLRSIVPRGLFWNDHALAYRMAILIDFWQIVRRRPDFDAAAAKQLLELATRTAMRLAKPELFTYRTNHGVMQNVALLQFVTAFPQVHKDVSGLRDLACARLRDQMRFYIADEGPVLEHSAGYHELGDYILGVSIRLFELNHCLIPSDWRTKLVAARSFSTMLNRPDGSMPSLGNTDYAEVASTYDEWDREPPRLSFGLYPVSGFAVWWSGLSAWPQTDRLAQTVVTWSKFPSRAHKRADDMSVILWARGHSLTGNTGYWPYGMRGFDEAQGWRGANAPHFVGERGPVDDAVFLRGSADAGRVRVIDLERRAAGGGSALRRQIIEIDGVNWLIADSFLSSQPRETERIWTFMPNTRVESVGGSALLLRPEGASLPARLSIVGELAAPPKVLRGQYEPFGGWIVSAGMPLAAPAMEVRHAMAGAPVLSVFEIAPLAALGEATLPTLAAGATADNWRVELRTALGPAEVVWGAGKLTVTFVDGSMVVAPLLPAAPESALARSAIWSAYEEVAAKYSVHRPITEYRYKISYLAFGLLVLQEAIMLAVRWRYARATAALRWLAAGFWMMFGLVAAFWYLV